VKSSIVVAGGGFAGVWAALSAARERHRQSADVNITLVSDSPYLTIRPRLYEREPEKLRAPLADSLDPVGVRFILASVMGIDVDKRTVHYTADKDDASLNYDRLIMAAGSRLRPLPGLSNEHTWNIDSYDAAVAFDRHLGSVLESGREGDATIVIIGSGFTGIELATELRNRISAHTEKATANSVRIILLEKSGVLAEQLGGNVRPYIEAALQDAAVEVRLGVRAQDISDGSITLEGGERIAACTVVNTTGMIASELADLVPADRDPLGRLLVDDCLRVADVDGVFACGDIASARVDEDHKALMSCQHAMPMGRFAGYNALRELLGQPLEAYRQPDYVTCLDLGAAGAVFTRGWDRQVEMNGQEARQLKQKINGEWIYPPTGEKQAILDAADIHIKPRRQQLDKA